MNYSGNFRPAALLPGLLLIIFLPGCRSPVPESSAPRESGVSLLDQRLLEVIEMEQRLDEAAAQPDADPREIQRRFRIVDLEYQGILARNPRSLEARLLYGKLLSRFGDRESAKNQFLSAAQIDPDIAVIHQQLSTYFAEEKDYTRALAYILNAIRIEPGTAAYHFQLGQLLAAFSDEFITENVFSKEQLDEQMLSAFETAKQLQPEELPLQFRYGEAFYDLANPDWSAALQHWQSLMNHPNLVPLQKDAITAHQVRCLVELGQLQEASRLLPQIQSDLIRASAQNSLQLPDFSLEK